MINTNFEFKDKKRLFLMIFYVILILVLLFLIIQNLTKTEKIKNNNIYKKNIKNIQTIKDLKTDDTDGDGLKDWEELLYKTDTEKEDTDGDGMSDFFEVENDYNPLIFGKGSKDENIKILKSKEILSSIKDQKKDLDDYKQKLWDKEAEKFNRYLLVERKKNISDEIIKLNYNKDKEKIKKEVNILGGIISEYEIKQSTLNIETFRRFFDTITKNNNIEKIPYSDLKNIENIANINLILSKELKNTNFKNEEMKDFSDSFAIQYGLIGLSLKEMLTSYQKKEKIENKLIEKYGDAFSDLILLRQKINIFVLENNLNFDEYDEGSIFKY